MTSVCFQPFPDRTSAMVFLLGLISLLQTAFLPGFLLLSLLRLSDGLIKTLVLSFALSLIFNHLVVFLLVAMGIYGPQAMFVLLGLELLALNWMLWQRRREPPGAALQNDWQRGEDLVRELSRSDPAVRLCGTAVALLAVWMIGSCVARVCVAEAGTVFVEWDVVVSWNPWALAWAENRLPSMTFHYPQLLPCNWSVSYVLMGDARIQFFAKWLMSWPRPTWRCGCGGRSICWPWQLPAGPCGGCCRRLFARVMPTCRWPSWALPRSTRCWPAATRRPQKQITKCRPANTC